MNDETTTQTTQESANAAEDAAKTAAGNGDGVTTQIMNELSQLSHKVAAAVQTALESEERYKAEAEIRKALKMAGDRIDHVAEEVRKSDLSKDVQSQATRAADAVQKSDVTKQLKQGFLSGLRRFNEELNDFLDKNKPVESAAEAGKAAAADAQAAADAASAVVDEAAEKAKTL
ncbi:MAG TPA: hypothetical protein PKM78_06635 [Anaerolineae bacterium]|nr:hypothetical protein [Anaerolineae bacterium]HNU03522.1 hypothetical protein [Anaerolineae bacterium]